MALRRDLHAHPELAFDERRTAGIVAAALRLLGLDVAEGIAGTGVVGTLRHGNSCRAVGLRADMDALPIAEQSRLAHASRAAGVHHGCGHDGHTAMLLGAAQQLARTRRFDGTVHFIFQPAEEGRGEADVTYHRYYPATVNSAAEAQLALRAAELAGLRASVAPRPAFTSEDFAFMVRERPGAYLWLGQGGSERPLHHPCYDFNDEALPHGVCWLCAVAEMALAA